MKPPSSLYRKSLIDILLVALRSAFLIGSISLMLWLLYTTVCFFTDTPMPSSTLPVMFSTADGGGLSAGDQPEIYLKMPIAIGWISAENEPKGFVAVCSIFYFLANLCLLLAIRLTIQVLEAAGSGAFFLQANAVRLRGIALTAFGILFFYRLATIISASHFKNKLQFPGLEFNSHYIFYFGDLLYIMGLLFLLVLAEAFRIGAIVKAENDLTI
jgi:hypothetical protein